MEEPLRAKFASIGIGPGKKFDFKDLSIEHKAAVGLAIKEGFEKIGKAAEGIGKNIDGWQVGAAFGDREFYKGDWLLRAAAAKAGIYGNDAVEAMYPQTRVDSDGQPLDGSKHRYTLTFAKDQLPPVNAFWSITMYDGKNQLLVDNPINRYLINSPMLPGMKKNPDGSLTLFIQKDSPGKAKEANWLPAPDGPIYLVMRLYWPKDTPPSILPAGEGTWNPPGRDSGCSERRLPDDIEAFAEPVCRHLCGGPVDARPAGAGRDVGRGARQAGAEPGGQPGQRAVPEQHQLQRRPAVGHAEHPEHPAGDPDRAQQGLEPHHPHDPALDLAAGVRARPGQHLRPGRPAALGLPVACRAGPDGLIWGAGAILQAPTNTDDVLGNDNWGLGPTAVVLKLEKGSPWVYGVLVNNVWSLSSSQAGGRYNNFLMQPFLNYNFPGGMYLTSAPIVTANWEADSDQRWTVPLGGGIGKIFHLDRLPLNTQIGAYYNVVHPDNGATWSLRLQVQFMFPK